MTGTWKDMDRSQRRAAERAFDALATVDSLTETATEAGQSRAVGFSDLYTYANGPSGPRDGEVRAAVLKDPRLRRNLDRLLARQSVCHFARAAAASSGDVDSREGEGFRLRIRRSKAVETQCYVIIEIEPGFETMPSALFAKTSAGAIDKYPLPEAQGGTIQILTDEDSDLVRSLRDPHTEVYLR